MKIVHISPYAMDRPGGVQTHIRDLCQWLDDTGHETRIIAPPADRGRANVTAANVMGMGGFREISMHGTRFEITRARRQEVRRVARDLRDWGADVVHLHTPWTPMLVWQMWRALDLPSVATFHATLPDSHGFDPVTWFLGRAAGYFNARLARVVVPSGAPLAQWVARGADPVPDILPPTIDLSAWRAARGAAAHGTGDGTKIGTAPTGENRLKVVYMGRLEARKGVQDLLEAWRRVAAALPDAELTIAGAGVLGPALRAFVAAHDLGSVRFCAPPDDAGARALVAGADLFVAPATGGESFGLVLIEAMAAGTVPVAAANEGFATVLTPGGEAMLVPPRDAPALAARIIHLGQHPDHRAALRAWCVDRANAFDVATVGPRYVALYRDVLRQDLL